MSPSTSANKVARVAARSGGSGRPAGSSPSTQKNWLFPLAIVAIVALGVAIVVFARSKTVDSASNATKPRAQLAAGEPADHWHSAFALNVCGKELPVLPEFDNSQGIHTHGDGLIHVHPFEIRAAGKGATLGRFLDGAGVEINDDAFSIAGQKEKYEAGETTCGGKPTELVLAYWKRGITAETTPPTEVLRSNFGKERFTSDLTAMTLALVPKGTKDKDIPAPATAAQVAALGSCDGANPDPVICGGATQAPPNPGQIPGAGVTGSPDGAGSSGTPSGSGG